MRLAQQDQSGFTGKERLGITRSAKKEKELSIDSESAMCLSFSRRNSYNETIALSWNFFVVLSRTPHEQGAPALLSGFPDQRDALCQRSLFSLLS